MYDAYWDSSLNNWQAQKINAHGNTSGPLAVGMPMACNLGDEEHVAYMDAAGNAWDSWRDATGNWSVRQIPIGPAATDIVFVWTDAAHKDLHFTYKDANGVIWDATSTSNTTTHVGTHTGGVLTTVGSLS